MVEQAQVSSIDALKEFRDNLSAFNDMAKEALTIVDMETRRTLDWLQRDQLAYWKAMIRECEEELAQAKADLFRRQLARLSGEPPDMTEQKKAVRRAQARLEMAQEKVEKCKEWARLVMRAIDEYSGPARQLGTLVEGEPARSVIALDNILTSLDAYVYLAPPTSAPMPTTSAAAGTEAPSAGTAARPAEEVVTAATAPAEPAEAEQTPADEDEENKPARP
jgi:hypothetical protein